jgi:hypothetical protein
MNPMRVVTAGLPLAARCCRLCLPLLLAVTAAASAAPVTDEELRAEVVYWCYVQSGEFGTDAVDLCVRDEFAAAKALQAYPPSARVFREACDRRAGTRGLTQVKACVDEEIAFEAELATYAADRAPRIEACRLRYGSAGAARVRRCIEDPSVPAGPPPRRPADEPSAPLPEGMPLL